jgi:predicted nucleotidyltransferase
MPKTEINKNDNFGVNITGMKITEKNIERIKQLCKEYRVKNFSVFGSVLNDSFSSDSDIDFIVDFDENDPIKYTDLYFGLKDKLEKTLKRQIDLIEERGIKNPFFRKEIEESKVVIYG